MLLNGMHPERSLEFETQSPKRPDAVVIPFSLVVFMSAPFPWSAEQTNAHSITVSAIKQYIQHADSLPVAVADCARAAVLFNHIPVLHALVAEYALNINGIKPETRVDWAGLQPRVLSGPRDMQPLHHLVFLACYSTDPCNVLQFLIQSGVDVNAVSALPGQSPVFIAIHCGLPSVLRILLDAGCAIFDVGSPHKQLAEAAITEAFYYSCEGKRSKRMTGLRMLEIILKHCAELDEELVWNTVGAAFMCAMLVGIDLPALKLFLKSFPRLSLFRGEQAKNCLYYSPAYESPDVLATLVEAGVCTSVVHWERVETHEDGASGASVRWCSAMEMGTDCEAREVTDGLGRSWVDILSPEFVSWRRRCGFLHCLRAATKPTSCLEVATSTIADDATVLLSDRRVASVRGLTIVSAIAGIVTTFLPTCCEDPLCITNTPYGASVSEAWTSVLPAYVRNAAGSFNVM